MRWLVVVALVAACSRDKAAKEAAAPSCAEVTDHVHAVFDKQYPGHGNAMNRANDIQQCEQRKLSLAERRCVLAARTLEAIGKCREKSVKAADESTPAKP